MAGVTGPVRKVTGRLRAVDQSAPAVNAARRLRRVLPGDPGFGDPLSSAGRDSAATVARVADRLFDDQPTALREVGLGALQVWSAFTGSSSDREVTLLFTDLVGFSTWALAEGDEATLVLLRAVAKAIEPPVSAHRGRVVKRLGDGLMATFPSAQLGFQAVTEARARLAEVEVLGYQPVLRAALHTGSPKALGGDLLGVDVNIAARLCERAGADEVLVSDTALAGLDPERVHTRRKKSFVWSSPKGVPAGLVVYTASPKA
jgi:adenylate cyclase